MKVLIAEDDRLFQRVLAQVLAPRYEVTIAPDGDEAWAILQRPNAPRLAILDWVMPGLAGPEICRKVRASRDLSSMYLLIVTSKNNEADIVAGLRAGADDYVTKPPVTAELLARVRVGERVLSLQERVKPQAAVRARTSRRDRSFHESVWEAGLRMSPARREDLAAVVASCRPHSPAPRDRRPISLDGSPIAVNPFANHFLESLHSKR